MAKAAVLTSLPLLVLWLILPFIAPSHSPSDNSFVTLLYSDDHLFGARVLGQSLLDTGTTQDRVVLCTDTVSAESRNILQHDGWIVKVVDAIPNPTNLSPYYSGTYTKLTAWDMMQYKRVVYLDTDTVVLSNVEHSVQLLKTVSISTLVLWYWSRLMSPSMI